MPPKLPKQDISHRARDMPLSNFGKKVSKQTDCHIYITFSNICRVYINIPRMASNIFRQIARQKTKDFPTIV